MKKKNSVLITVIATLVLLALAAFVFVQPYLNSTPYTTDENIASFLGAAFGKYPRFVNEKDLDKVEVLEIGTSDGYQYISLAFDGFVEKRDSYIQAYDNAVAEGLEAPATPDFTKYLASFETDGSVKDFIAIENFKNLVEVNIMADAYPVSANLEEFKNAASLKVLSIKGSTAKEAVKVNDISVLADKTELTSLSLVGNDISDISVLSGLSNLESVALDSNNISDFSVFAGNDMMALGAYKACVQRGISIPGDVSLVGFDDIYFADVLEKPLTTVHLDNEAIGRALGKTLIAALKKEPVSEPTVFTPNLVIRGTTAKPKK